MEITSLKFILQLIGPTEEYTSTATYIIGCCVLLEF